MQKFLPFVTSLFITHALHAQLNIDFLGQLTYDAQLSNLTGWADDDGNEYAIVGTEDGTSIVDITDPTAPEEVQFIDGVNSIWREVRTWEHYAYVVTEGGGGLLCIDLSGLPGTVDYNLTDCNIGLNTGHTVFCDENGYVHVFGSNLAGGGDVILNANDEPLDPEYVGEVDLWYIHDGYVRGDTLWAANIYDGHFSVWDISDKTDPILLASQNTPDNFTHNTWLTDDGNYLFTTDEVTNAVVASYDVSDLSDIQELDQFRANPGTSSIPHNTFVKGNFLVTAYYRDGVVITDATYPDILIKTGEYDTSPLGGSGFNGAWGCWPFLPSGNIIVSDMEEGLFILGPTYVQACYVEGNVTNASTGANLFDVSIDISMSPDAITTTDITGYYATGVAEEGFYDITFSKTGFTSVTIEDVSLTSGAIITVDAELEPLASYTFTGHVIDASTSLPVPDAPVFVQGETVEYETITDASGNFSIASVYEDEYDIYAGKWGYFTTQETDFAFSSGSTLTLYINQGYYDDYILDLGWETSFDGAISGYWDRDSPLATEYDGFPSNPGDDVTGDFGDKCYVTGSAGGAAGDNDVDNGYVYLTSPIFDLSDYTEPYISFYYWFNNTGGSGTPNDTLVITLSNGASSVDLVAVDNSLVEEGEWLFFEAEIESYLTATASMQLQVRIGDNAPGHICEGAIDKFMITDVEAAPVAAFEADNTSGCEPFTVHFTDMSSFGPTSWEWVFEGGEPATSSVENPIVTYSTPGTYAVELSVSNPLGSNSISIPSYITVYDSPELSVSTGPGTATVTISGGTAPFAILWNDDAAQTTETATGLAIGVYMVTVTDANGCITTATAEIQTDVAENLLPGFQAQIGPNPMYDQLHVEIAYQPAIFSMLIEDVTGKTIVSEKLQLGNNVINTSQFPQGLYTIKILVDNKLATLRKIVKQ